MNSEGVYRLYHTRIGPTGDLADGKVRRGECRGGWRRGGSRYGDARRGGAARGSRLRTGVFVGKGGERGGRGGVSLKYDRRAQSNQAQMNVVTALTK